MRPRLWRIAALAMLLIAALGVACCKPESAEARVRAVIAAAVHAAEAGDAAGISALLSSRYADGDGHDRRALAGVVRLYLMRRRPLYLYTRIPSVALTDGERAATAIVYAAMAGGRVDAPADLVRMSASLYRFDLTLELEQDQWRVRAATWRPAELSEFY